MYKLIRKNDGLTKTSEKVTFIEFDGNGLFLKQHEKPNLNLSLLMSPFNRYFTWQTTLITDILEDKEDYLHFKTENSEYELFKEEN